MFSKSIIAAGVVAGALVGGVATAEAKPHVNFFVGIGSPGYDNGYDNGYYDNGYGYGDGYYNRRSYPGYGPHLFGAPDFIPGYDRFPVYSHRHAYRGYRDVNRISCNAGARIVDNSGFDRVTAYDCSAPTYGYHATRYGRGYNVRVSSGGAIISASRR